MKFKYITLILLLGIWVSEESYASCGLDTMPISERAKKAVGIFSGEILKVDEIGKQKDILSKIAVIKVKEVFKGPFREGDEVPVRFRVQMEVPEAAVSCEDNLIDLRTSKNDYIVYVGKEGGQLFTSEHWGTEILNGRSAQIDLAGIKKLLKIRKK
jgi:hypothetical protein